MRTERKPVQAKPETYSKLVKVKGKIEFESGLNFDFDETLNVLASGFLDGATPSEIILSLRRKGGKP